ncbi:MAG: LptF/LptG family permease [Candidatus Liberibacter asiaticus]|uniref:Permease n=3 Tax=Liberibacter asiaticus TaxID=34021 RepID=A0ABM5NF05_LIBAS|nr:putative permease [Candidatus Liberibacter asiaticus str. gxpsy]ASK52489.1 permease [Candidatus Liberibacter asiaticus]KIH95590.1 permease [Candidatus Liberibacter asiaticus]KPG63595.1 permease [Candidatus Liberibacter asiaticus]KRF68953.1 permease [Candidatus Liberibacter asiaticus]
MNYICDDNGDSMPGILWRYFFKYYLKTTLYFLLGAMILVFVIDLNEIQNQMGELPNYSISRGAVLAATRVPLIIQQIIPFITLVVNIVVFFNLNRTSELVISRAIGISIWQLLNPFVVGSILLGIFTVLVINPIATSGEKIGIDLIQQWKDNGDKQKSDIIPWMQISNPQQDIFIGAKKILPENHIWEDFTSITIDKKNKIIHRKDADLAIIYNDKVKLKKVVEYQYGRIPIDKNSTTLNIPIKMDGFQKFSEQFASRSFYEIIKKMSFSNKSNIFHNYRAETQFYFLIVIPLMLVAMTLIAASVSLEFSRSNQPRIIVAYGIFSGFMLYTIITIMKSFGKSGILLPVAAALIPVILTISLSILILLQKEDG